MKKNKMPVVSVFPLPLFLLLLCPLDCSEFGSKTRSHGRDTRPFNFYPLYFHSPEIYLKNQCINKMSTPIDNFLFLMFDGGKNGFLIVFTRM